MTEYGKNIYVYSRVAEEKAKIYTFLSKQRLNLSAAVIKICYGDITL